MCSLCVCSLRCAYDLCSPGEDQVPGLVMRVDCSTTEALIITITIALAWPGPETGSICLEAAPLSVT